MNNSSSSSSFDPQLSAFRAIAEAMNPEPQDWQWVGPHMSQRMFGISESRAKAYAARHGGVAAPISEGRRI
jgi:hypothetical protein